MSETTKYNEWFGGWLAFKHGKVLQTRTGAVKVFRTEAEARKAAERSRMQFGTRR